MKQKVIVCEARNSVTELQGYLDKGWRVIFAIAEHITATDSSLQGTYGSPGHNVQKGKIVFIIEV